MSTAPDKGCTVAYATPERQFLWPLRLPASASIGDALAAARSAAGAAGAPIPWDAAVVGIFGQVRRRSDGFADGDRIEIYRPLEHDPRERRRAQVARARRAGRRG